MYWVRLKLGLNSMFRNRGSCQYCELSWKIISLTELVGLDKCGFEQILTGDGS